MTDKVPTHDLRADLAEILTVAEEWAGEYGFGMPEYCTEIFAKVARLRDLLDRGENDD